MTRRRWRIRRPMAVPATWQGTPDRFYHFLLGYLIPLALWQERTGAKEIAVRDSGPHNGWFNLLQPGTSVELVPSGVMLERYLSNRQERVVFHDWDNPTRFHHRSLTRGRASLLEWNRSVQSVREHAPRITVLKRMPSVQHYRDSDAETEGGAADWRSIPNISQVADALSDIGCVTVLDTAGMAPLEQVSSLLQTDLLVAQHGGGLSNMLWMESGRSVIEILPPRPPTIDAIFRNLAAARGLGYLAIAQESEHAIVNAQPIADAAHALLQSPDAHVPTPTGSWPMRLVRQLPRRL